MLKLYNASVCVKRQGSNERVYLPFTDEEYYTVLFHQHCPSLVQIWKPSVVQGS